MGFNVFLDLGDSNAVGFAMSAATLPAGLAGFDYGTTFIFGQGASYWGVYAPGVNSGTPNNPGAWGGEAQFLARVHAAYPDDVNLVISVQLGSTPLGVSAGRVDWSPASSDGMFATAKATLASAQAAFLAANGFAMPPVEAVLWTGGPNDAFDAGLADAYEANLTGFFAAIRGELLGQPDARILFSRMTDDAAALPYNAAVRLAQWTVDQGDPHATSFRTIGFALQADQVHYAPEGYVQLGDEFFDAWIS
ncbi:MAG: hypothetical protein KIS90_06390 [Phenylobacterium sp.]|nr:hypothetical protein [Phenylobacterium sp.]